MFGYYSMYWQNYGYEKHLGGGGLTDELGERNNYELQRTERVGQKKRYDNNVINSLIILLKENVTRTVTFVSPWLKSGCMSKYKKYEYNNVSPNDFKFKFL